MAALNPLTRELVFKIVFYGPGLGGKTTTLQAIHERTKPEHRGKLVSLATPTERTLYFDFLPLRVPRIRDLNVRLQLFTVPGQVYFSATRKLVLTGADGIVFVADSQPARMDANQESLEDLSGNLAEHGRSLSQIPHAFQWNKRDIADVVGEGELDRRFNLFAAPTTATVATRGTGVFDSLEKITRLVVEAYKSKMPREGEHGIAALDADDLGIEEAVRELAESDRAPQRSSPAPDSRKPAGDAADVRHSSKTMLAPVSAGPAIASRPETQGPASDRALTKSPPPSLPAGSFSFAAMWPEEERGNARRVEGAIAAGDWAAAVLACDLLVARVLASGAAIAGAVDAPRDPALVATLLGLPGPRYLAFRTAVRAARNQESLDSQRAMEAYLFALEVRRARSDVD